MHDLNTLMRTCRVALQISLLLSVLACGSPSDDTGMTTVNLTLAMPATSAQKVIGHSAWWAKLSPWLPDIRSAWAQVSGIGQLRIDVFASNGASLASQTVPVPDPTSGQMIPVSIKVPSGPQRRISVSALNTLGTKLYSGKKDTDLIPGTTLSLEITLAPTFEVTITVAPLGSGTVRASPPDVECNTTCAPRFDADTQVVLSAIPAADWSFVQWGGACTGRDECIVNKTASVSAQFRDTRSRALSLTKAGPLATSGTVSSLPAGINCGSDCSESFPIGTAVTLNASRTTGVVFSGWSGGGCGGTGSCTVTMTEDRTVSARFDVAAGYSVIEIIKSGAGTGTVASNPPGINCGTTCSGSFPSGSFLPSLLTLVATPAVGSTFSGWSGASSCGSDPTCVMFVLGSQTISAQFSLVEGS